METVEIFIDSKKKIQCRAIKRPTIMNFTNDFGATLNDFFFTARKMAIKAAAKNILYQTKNSECMVIKAPKIAVKPQIKTIKCKLR